MIYFIELRKNDEHTAGPKAPNDIYDISKKLGFKSLKLMIEDGEASKIKKKIEVGKLWLSLLFKLKKDDVIIFQHPMYGIKEAIKLIPIFKKIKKTKFITVIHDLELLRGGTSTYDEEVARLSINIPTLFSSTNFAIAASFHINTGIPTAKYNEVLCGLLYLR